MGRKPVLLLIAALGGACDGRVAMHDASDTGPAPTVLPTVLEEAPSAPPAAPAPSASAPVVVPNVEVENIGIHVGGGPNDAVTKAPIASSVEPRFADLRACWGSAEDPKRGGDFGVDLLIPAEGGHAKVSNPRTAIKGDAFRACVVAVFEGIDFAKPRTGRTTVSYSLRFTP